MVHVEGTGIKHLTGKRNAHTTTIFSVVWCISQHSPEEQNKYNKYVLKEDLTTGIPAWD